MRRGRRQGGVIPACVGLLVAVFLVGCERDRDESASPVAGLHACERADDAVGVFTGQAPTPSPHDSDSLIGFDAWVLDLSGTAQQLTTDAVYTQAVISADARTVYLSRSSGEIQGDSMAAAETIERLDLATGTVTVLAELSAIEDMSLSAEGRWLVVAHHLDDSAGQSGISVVDLSTGEVRAVPLPADANRFEFVAVDEVGISPDGEQVAYALAVETAPNFVERTLRLQSVDTADDSVVFTAPGAGHISDVVWSADGATVIAAWNSGDGVQIRRVHVSTGRTDVGEGFAAYIVPISADGDRLLGVSSTEQQQHEGQGSVTAWDRDTRVTATLPVTPAAAGLSIAACSYQ